MRDKHEVRRKELSDGSTIIFYESSMGKDFGFRYSTEHIAVEPSSQLAAEFMTGDLVQIESVDLGPEHFKM